MVLIMINDYDSDNMNLCNTSLQNYTFQSRYTELHVFL